MADHTDVSQVAPIETILTKYHDIEGALLPILHDVQAAYGYLSEESINAVAEFLRLSPTQIYGVATFYSQIHIEPRGKTVIRLCDGPACHMRGAPQIKRVIESRLGISYGESTADGQFTFEAFPCSGTCKLAPLLMVNETVYGQVSPRQVGEILEDLK